MAAFRLIALMLLTLPVQLGRVLWKRLTAD